jgi:ABC-type Na+ transport system ATPase subunit NatA
LVDLRTLFHGHSDLLWLAAPLFVVLAFFPVWLTRYTIISLNNIFVYIVLTVNWSLFSGPTGYISLASAAFFGTGIYTAAILGDKFPLATVVLAGGLLSFIIALLVGLSSMRLRGMYFTIFTFGLSELIRHAVLWWEVNISGTVGRLVVSLNNQTVYYILLATVFLNLLMIHLIRQSKMSARKVGRQTAALLEFVGLAGMENMLAGDLTMVNQKRLEIARALATEPQQQQLLDEVMAGLNPSEVDQAIYLVQKIRDQQITVFMIEHVMKAIMEISDRILALHFGTKIEIIRKDIIPLKISTNNYQLINSIGTTHAAVRHSFLPGCVLRLRNCRRIPAARVEDGS